MLRNSGRATLAGGTVFGFFAFFVIVGDVEVGSAVVTVAMPCVDIDTQRVVAFIVPYRETFITNCFHNTARSSANIDIITGKISHNFLFVFNIFLVVCPMLKVKEQ